MERWREIDEFPTYEVSSEGRVANRSTGRILKMQKHPRTGLWMVPLQKGLKQYTRAVHKLVAEAHVYPGPEGCVPFHIDGDRDNNHSENLEWKTLSAARALALEAKRTTPRDPRPVRLIEHNLEFANALTAARHVVGLERHILLAAQGGASYVYKGGHWEFC